MKLIETKQLSIQIGKRSLCDALTLRVEAGECWGILGPNGSGKTTLLQTLAGLRPADSGTVLLNDQPINHYSLKERAQQIALLFQEQTFPFPQSVWQYCMTSRYPYHTYFQHPDAEEIRIVESALTAVALLPLREQNVQTLSGGEKRRLAIAAVLTQTPAIYLLDEPVNHLDLRRQMQILKHLQQLTTTQQTAVLMTLHDINLARQFCTHLICIHPNGRVIQGKAREMFNAENLSALYEHPIHSLQEQTEFFWPA